MKRTSMYYVDASLVRLAGFHLFGIKANERIVSRGAAFFMEESGLWLLFQLNTVDLGLTMDIVSGPYRKEPLLPCLRALPNTNTQNTNVNNFFTEFKNECV